MNKGVERPLHLAANRRHRVQIIVDDTITTLYVDGGALNARMYAKSGEALPVYVVDGVLTVANTVLETGSKSR